MDNIKGSITGIVPDRAGFGTCDVNEDCTAVAHFEPGPGIALEEQMVIAAGGDEALRMATGLEETATSRYVPPYAIALVYLGLQRTDAMFQSLDRAYDARDVHLVFAPVDPKWDAFRGERRFQDVMSRCGFRSAHRTSSSNATADRDSDCRSPVITRGRRL